MKPILADNDFCTCASARRLQVFAARVGQISLGRKIPSTIIFSILVVHPWYQSLSSTAVVLCWLSVIQKISLFFFLNHLKYFNSTETPQNNYSSEQKYYIKAFINIIFLIKSYISLRNTT